MGISSADVPTCFHYTFMSKIPRKLSIVVVYTFTINIMTQPKPTTPSVEELQALLAKQAEEIERLKKEKEVNAKKPKGETIYDLIDSQLKVHDESPDALLWFDLLVFCTDKLRVETEHVVDANLFDEYAINLEDALRVLGYLKNNKIFGATKNKSKTKYNYKGFEDLDANTYIKYALQDDTVTTEPVLNEEDF